MNHRSMNLPTRVLIMLLITLVHGAACAQGGWLPERSVELVVPTGPGGGNDTAARTVHAIMQGRKLVDVPVTVVNKPGGGGAVAFSYLNQRPGDGRYLSVIPVTLITNHITGSSEFSHTDFTPIAQLYSEYIAFAVKADAPFKDGKELAAKLKQDPSSVSFGFASSAGNQNHITIAMMAKAAGVNIRQLKTVVFNSGGQAITSLLGGHLDVSSSGASGSLPHMEAGRVRIIAVAAPQRIPGPLANVPTWRELGLNVVFSSWRSMIGPKGMSEAQIAYWDGVVRKMIQSEEWKKDLEKNLWVSNYLNSRDSRVFLKEQYDDIRGILSDLGLAKR